MTSKEHLTRIIGQAANLPGGSNEWMRAINGYVARKHGHNTLVAFQGDARIDEAAKVAAYEAIEDVLAIGDIRSFGEVPKGQAVEEAAPVKEAAPVVVAKRKEPAPVDALGLLRQALGVTTVVTREEVESMVSEAEKRLASKFASLLVELAERLEEE